MPQHRVELAIRVVLATWRQAMQQIRDGRMSGDREAVERATTERGLAILDEFAREIDPAADAQLMQLVVAAREELTGAIPHEVSDVTGHADGTRIALHSVQGS